MHPLSLFPRRAIAALVVLSTLDAAPLQANERPPLPTCRPSGPVPPPEPPTRPEGLVAERPANPPIAEPPLPPQRPAELPAPSKPGTGAAPPDPPPSDPVPSDPTAATDAAPATALPTCNPAVNAPPPPERPAELSPTPAKIPEPPPRPAELAPVEPSSDAAPAPPGRPPELSGDGALKLTVTPQDDADCLRTLDDLGVKYAKLEPIVNGQCSVANPLAVRALGNDIGIGPPSTMVCRLAEGLMRWTAQVREIADKELGDPLKGFTLGGTYVCRGQNHGAEAQLSEHSFANAVDVMGFTFAKRAPITVGPLPEGSAEAAFLAAVRKKACDHFTTVLGPGSDEAHANHLHLDERERKPGYRLCQ